MTVGFENAVNEPWLHNSQANQQRSRIQFKFYGTIKNRISENHAK